MTANALVQARIDSALMKRKFCHDDQVPIVMNAFLEVLTFGVNAMEGVDSRAGLCGSRHNARAIGRDSEKRSDALALTGGGLPYFNEPSRSKLHSSPHFYRSCFHVRRLTV